MRVTVLVFSIAFAMAIPGAGAISAARAQGQECTGESCPTPSGQGRDCESKKENTIS